jgi:hypothetical protein
MKSILKKNSYQKQYDVDSVKKNIPWDLKEGDIVRVKKKDFYSFLDQYEHLSNVKIETEVCFVVDPVTKLWFDTFGMIDKSGDNDVFSYAICWCRQEHNGRISYFIPKISLETGGCLK